MKKIVKRRKQKIIRNQKKKKTRKKNIFRLFFWLLVFSFLGIVVYVFIFSNFLKITKIEISDNDKISKEEIVKEIDNELSGKFLSILPKNNWLFIKENNLKNALLNQNKEIEEIEIKKIFPDKMQVKITEKKLFLLLCSQGECYFLNNRGEVYAKVNEQDDQRYLANSIKIIDQSQEKIIENKVVLTEEMISFLKEIANEFAKETNIVIGNEYQISSVSSSDIIVQTDKGWDIYLNSQLPLEKVIRTFKTVLDKKFDLNDLHNLEYVDLRFANKVFYRLRGYEEQEEEKEEEE